MSLRRETKREDDARTGALLDAVDKAFDDGGLAQYHDPDFEDVVLFGIAGDPAQQYPPAGHTFPRRG
ncbi:hypothetical protein ACFWWT_45275 [Streptomyces sp. NPDC058676]|uniref:hypothetical protein n=1 Tax=unclassified Streptomyces TaxID=2593676 RepID=UPI0036544640